MLSTIGALYFLTGSLVACTADREGMEGYGQLCLDRAKHENALYGELISSVLPAAQRVSVDEWNGCDSANNGAALSVTVSADLSRADLWGAFVKAGWSADLAWATCGEKPCDEYQLAKKVSERIFGVAIQQDTTSTGGGLWVEVMAADGCWDDHGYRCGDH